MERGPYAQLADRDRIKKANGIVVFLPGQHYSYLQSFAQTVPKLVSIILTPYTTKDNNGVGENAAYM